jgi:hypothetical protein
MKIKMTGAAGLAGAFIAGMVVATALGGGMAAAGAKTQATGAQGQVTVERVISPTVTEADIALLRQDIRAMKMQVIGENMSLSDTEAHKFWPMVSEPWASRRSFRRFLSVKKAFSIRLMARRMLLASSLVL